MSDSNKRDQDSSPRVTQTTNRDPDTCQTETYLVKPAFFGERDADLANASRDPLIRAVEVEIPLETPVHRVRQTRRERAADRETAAAERHVVRVHHVLLDALRVPADVPHLLVVVLREDLDEILREEDGVVVSHHEPPHVGEVQTVAIPDHACDPNRGLRAGESEPGPAWIGNSNRD